MIVKITRGGRVPGLMAYLVGPGRANEHTDPHLVAGSDGVMAWFSDDQLNHETAMQVAGFVDAPRKITGTEVTVPEREFDEAAGEWVNVGHRAAHVWHCSLSLAPDHRPLEDAEWASIAGEFVDEMGFSDVDGKAPCRWVAINHGLSKNGGDHIHLMVNLVREDGTKASTHLDYKRASAIVKDLEVRHALEVVAGRHVGRSARAESKAEVYDAERRGAGETYSRRLVRKVRAHAGAAVDEADFVRRCRAGGLMVRPRFAAGGQDVVTGFSVAESPPGGEAAVWRAAGKLDRALTLPRLRETWPDTPEHATAAADQWRAAWRGTPLDATAHPEEDLVAGWDHALLDAAVFNERLRKLDPRDYTAWSTAAQQAAGVLSAWSVKVEGEAGGPLADAAEELARVGALHQRARRQAATTGPDLRGLTQLALLAAADPRSRTAQALLLRQIIRTMRAVHDAHTSTGQARQATRLRQVTIERLGTVRGGLPDVDALARRLEERARAHAAGKRRPDRPLPAPGTARARQGSVQDRATGAVER
ncbi:hypothetical protein GCM10027425_33750 [Alteromonas gracilis]